MSTSFDPNTARLVRPEADDAPPKPRAFDPSTARLAPSPAPQPVDARMAGTAFDPASARSVRNAFDPSTAKLAPAASSAASSAPPRSKTFDASSARVVQYASPIDDFDANYSSAHTIAAPPSSSIVGDVGRSLAQAGLSTARTLGLAGAGALEAATLGNAPTALTDPIFRGVDAIKDYQDTIPRAKTTGGRIAEAIGGLIGAIPTLGVGNLSEGQDIIREGGSLGHALGQTALNAAGDIAGLGLGKLGEKASVVTRALSQGAANTAFGEASRVAGNAIAPEERQREFDPLDAAINFGAGVGFGVLPHAREPVASKEGAPFVNHEGGAVSAPPLEAAEPTTHATDIRPTAPGRQPFPEAAPGSLADAVNVIATTARDANQSAPREPLQMVEPLTGNASPIPDPTAGSIKGVETGAMETADGILPSAQAPGEPPARASETPPSFDGKNLTKPNVEQEFPGVMQARENRTKQDVETQLKAQNAPGEIGTNRNVELGLSDAPAIEADPVGWSAETASHPDAAILAPASDVSGTDERAQPITPIHAALQAIASGDEPARILEGADDGTVRAIAAALGRKFSPKAPARAIIDRLGEQTRGDRVKRAQVAIAQLEPASERAGSVEPLPSSVGESFAQPLAANEPARVAIQPDQASAVETAARESAAHPESEAPATAAQQEAGNHKMGHVNLHGLDVTIEVPKGGLRRGTAKDGTPWERSASDHYGYIKRTESADGEQVDVYLGPHAENPDAKVFVIDQVRPGTNVYDESKAMIGFTSGRAARASYEANFPKGLKTFGGIREMSMGEFKQWAKDGSAKKPATDQVMSPKAAVHEAVLEMSAAGKRSVAVEPTAATDSAAFRRFFGASKVVDREGAPKIVHHGTGESFTVFNSKHAGAATEHATSPLGHFFTEDRAQARRYAENASEGRPADERVIDAYLSIKKPYEMTLEQAQAIETPAQARALRAKLEGEGYDGIRIAKAKTWIAFESGQAKSVENRGTFDRANPDINYSRTGRPTVDRTTGLGEQEVRRIAEGITRVAGHADQGVVLLRVVGATKELPQAVRDHMQANGIASEEIRGVHWKGTSYLVAEHLTSRKAVEETIFHEHYAHGGLRAKYGNRVGSVMARLAKHVGGLDGIRQLAKEQGIDLSHYEATTLGNPHIPAKFQIPYLMEELMAHLSESTGTLRRVIQEYVGAVRAWLRANHFAELADYGVTDLAHVLKQARQAATEKVTARGDAPLYQRAVSPESSSLNGGGAPMFQRRRVAEGDVGSAGAEHLNDEQRAALGKIGTLARGEKLPEKWKRLTERWREKLTQGLVDQFAPLKGLDKDAYMQARLSRGTDGALEAMFLHGTPKLTDGALDVTSDGKGLRGLLAGLHGEHDLFLAWMAGHRAEALSNEWEVAFGDGATKRYRSEAEARAAAAESPGARAKAASRENLFSPEDIAALKRLDQGMMPNGEKRSAAYAKARTEFRRYQKAVLDVAEQAGLIDADSRATWESDFYVPFYRQAESDPASFTPSKVGSGLVRQQAFEQLKGGTERLNDLLGNTLANWSHLLAASMRNMAASKAIAAAERMGIAERVGSGEKGSVWISRQGQPVHYRVSDPLVVDALTMLNSSGLNTKAMRAMGAMKRALSFGVTINPAFRIRNLLRDTLSAMAVSDAGFNPLRNIVQGWRSTGAESETFHRLLASGGAVRFGSLNDGEQAVHAKRLIQMGVKDAQILDSKGKIANALSHAWEWWKEVGDRGETVNRAVIYERAKARGATHLEASYEARDLLDFTMGGKWAAMRFLVQTVPFLNARVQGLYKLARGAQTNPTRFAAVTGSVALASAALYLLQKDDPDYRNLPDWARDTYWCVKLGDKMLFLPKPFEIGALGSVIERGTELATSGNDYQTQDFARSLLGIVVDQLSMNPIPQAVRPLTEAFFNYDTFRGRPIDSEGQERLPPADRYTARTSVAAVGIGKASNVSPQRIEHLVEGYFGWLGLQALNVTDLLARPLTDLPSNPNRDFYSVSNWPVAGDFVKSTAGMSSKYIDRFYANQQQTEQLYAAYSMARKAGDVERALDLAGTDAVRLRKLGNAMNRRMQEINQRIRRATSDRSLGATEKRTLLEGLTQQRNRIAEHADEMRRASMQ